MTIATQFTPTSTFPRSNRVWLHLLKPIQLSFAVLYRCGWHLRAYSVILVVALLTVASVLILQLVWKYERWVKLHRS